MTRFTISFIKALGQFALLSGVIIVLFAVSNKLLGNQGTNDNSNRNVPVVNPNPTNINVSTNPNPTDFDKYKELIKKGRSVDLLSEKGQIISPEFTASDQKKNNEIANEFLQKNSIGVISNGKISSGYLYIKAGAGNPTDILEQKESIYIFLLNGTYGGHLYKPLSLVKVPTEDGYSQYLFKLENIPFTSLPYNDENPSKDANWTTVLQQNTSFAIPLGGFVSANRFSKIVQITIAYDGEAGALSLR